MTCFIQGEWETYRLVDIRSNYCRPDIDAWAVEAGIVVKYHSQYVFRDKDGREHWRMRWYVGSESERLMFILRWS